VTHAAFYDARELADLVPSLSSSVPMMATSYSTTARNGTVSAPAHCSRDVTSAGCGCSRCLEESARELPRNCCGGGWALDGRAGFNCHLRLRLEIHAPDLPFGKMIREFFISLAKSSLMHWAKLFDPYGQ
jgi:hypothetical protein